VHEKPEYREQWRSSADGIALYHRLYDRAGPAAPAVMCLPGLTRNSKDFEDLARHLAPRYRVICPDLRGRGQSGRDPVWKNYHPGTYLADLAALLAELGIARLAVVGTSLGGLLAMLLPSVRPGIVAGMVLNDIGPEIDPVGAERIRGYAGRLPAVRDWSEATAQLRTVFGAAWPGLDEATWSRLAHRSYRADANGTPVADVDPFVGEALRAAPATAGDLWPVFATLGQIPVLAIRGALSDILSLATFERMQREHPRLTALSVANRGHVPLLDEPESLQAIDAFLARLAY
jgi:pimeloyl-ACP methyl ester carboxylesterase